jgi:hypothetical protein
MLLLDITVTCDLTFVDHFNILLLRTRSNTDDLDRAGATANGFNLCTSLSMWTTLFIPNYIYAMHIWYNDHMQQQLDKVLLAPVISMIAPMAGAYITQEHSDIITLELRLPLAISILVLGCPMSPGFTSNQHSTPRESCVDYLLLMTLTTETYFKPN